MEDAWRTRRRTAKRHVYSAVADRNTTGCTGSLPKGFCKETCSGRNLGEGPAAAASAAADRHDVQAARRVLGLQSLGPAGAQIIEAGVDQHGVGDEHLAWTGGVADPRPRC